MTYPIILRKKVLELLKQGKSIRKATKLYDISPTAITNWNNEVLKQNIIDYPDAYYYERAA